MKKFELVMTEDDGVLNINSVNDGFNVFELIGMLEEKKQDLIKQVNEQSKYVHTRVYKKDGDTFKVEEAEES